MIMIIIATSGGRGHLITGFQTGSGQTGFFGSSQRGGLVKGVKQ